MLAAARLGADWAWNVLYRSLAPVVLGYLRAHAARDPENLTGEVFLQVARDLASFSGGEGEFRAWVMVLTHHRFLDERRYDGRRPVQPVSPETLVDAGGATGGVEDIVLRTMTAERVRQLIDGLTGDQRDVLLLRILGGFSIEEVAGMIHKRPSAVKALQRRGLGAVRRALGAEADGSLPQVVSLAPLNQENMVRSRH